MVASKQLNSPHVDLYDGFVYGVYATPVQLVQMSTFAFWPLAPLGAGICLITQSLHWGWRLAQLGLVAVKILSALHTQARPSRRNSATARAILLLLLPLLVIKV